MTSVRVQCPRCIGQGWLRPPGTWVLCAGCDGLGVVWAPGAPLFGCTITLGDRIAGEVVELGNGVVGRILWHSPRPKKKADKPEVTYLGIIDGFDDTESDTPTRFPSCVGVRSVSVSRPRGDDDHQGERGGDLEDPIKRRNTDLL